MNLKRLFYSCFVISISFIGAYALSGFTLSKLQDSSRKKMHSFDILHYTISLDIVDLSLKQIKGITDIQLLSNVDSLKEIKLDLLSMTVDSVWIDDEPIAKYNYNGTKLLIPTSYPLFKGLTVVVSIFYHGSPKHDSAWGGFYFYDKQAFNMGVGIKSNPHPFARAWYPCIDTFSDKATYDYFITVKKGYKALCGGSLVEVFNNRNGTYTYHWNLRDPIPTYLSSVTVGDFYILRKTFQGAKGDIPILIGVNPSDTADALKSLSKIDDYLSVFENLFCPYPWEKVGFSAVNFKGGAMEHATNITIPASTLDGTFSRESLLTHELAHSWFGNLVTCSDAKDIWINEGWASYCEAIYEESAYGEEGLKKSMRANHKETLRVAHLKDKSYLPLYDPPSEYIYGATVYMKGQDVVHTLRGYLGDDLFFKIVKEYFTKYAFKNISVPELRDFISKESKVDLTDFFDTWVFAPGFPHFSIDSFKVSQKLHGNEVEIFVRQKLKGRKEFSYSNIVEVTFMDKYWNSQTERMNISGEFSQDSFLMPFKPVCAFLDLEEKVTDATIDNYLTINELGEYKFDKTYFTAIVKEIKDSAFIRVEHSWVAPDNFKASKKGILISKNRYWKVDGVIPQNFYAKGKFYYNGSESSPNGWLDNTLITNSADSLVLLYRPDTKHNWSITPFQKVGNNTSGHLIADTLKMGEYALAIRDWKRYVLKK